MLANGACHFLWLIQVRLWNCASIRVPLMVAQIRLLFADISRRKINFWALPNSKISILSTFPAFSSPSLSPSFCAVLIMSRHWAPLLLVLSGLWCACLQVEKWMAVSKAWLLFQAQVLSHSKCINALYFPVDTTEKFLLGGFRAAESYTFFLSVSYFHHSFYPVTFISSHKKHQTVINRMSGCVIPLMELNLLWT